jgi:predicted DsbA family dithiol-disulfide isomerase
MCLVCSQEQGKGYWVLHTSDAPEAGATVPHETPRVLVFFDYACQFCYLDWPRLKRLRFEHGAELIVVPFELRPQLPAEGVPLAQIGVGHSPRVVEHMNRMAHEGGLALMTPTFVPNTHFALALGELARDKGPQVHEAVHEAIFSAFSGRGLDIGSEEVLLGIAVEQGLDRSEAAAAFDEGRYDDRIHQFHHMALSFGITATPSALICNELFIGSRPYEVLEEAIERCLLTEHNIASHLAQTVEGGPQPTTD